MNAKEVGKRCAALAGDARWEELARSGALGLPIAKELGGRGATLVETAKAYEALGKELDDGGLLLAAGAHLFGVALAIAKTGSTTQRARWLPDLAKGARVATVAATELEAGSDVAKVETTARVDGEALRIRGEKRFVTSAARADVFLVVAKNEGGAGLTTAIVEKSEGVTVGAAYATSGLASAGLAPVSFDCVVHAENILGKAGAGMAVFQAAMTFERALILAFRVGAMERELEAAVKFARARRVGGVAIATHDAVRHRVARMKRRLETSRQLVHAAAAALDRGERAHAEAALAKWHVAESAVESSLDAFHLRAGSGFLAESGAMNAVADALGGSVHSGTSDVLATIVAKWLGL